MKREKLVSLSDRVAELVEEYGSYRAAGTKIGVDFGYLFKIANAKKNPSVDALRRMGLRRVITFERLSR